ncbi:MAG TPA: cytochrome c3 family protein [bacterium]|nr:cytochrome c3 family protein [bacterium]
MPHRRGVTMVWLLLWAAALMLTVASRAALGAEKTCYDCHEEAKTRFKKKVQHEPVAKGDCEDCHLRHGFSNMLILKKDGKELCLECHTDFDTTVASGAHAHPAFAQGMCNTCHEPHASDQKGLIRHLDGDVVCLACHKQLADTSSASRQHPPFAERACGQCHVPHTGPLDKLLNADQRSQCGVCHDNGGVQRAHDAKGINPAGLECSGCHDPHRSSKPALIGEHVHPPVADGMCDACHTGEPVPPQSIGAADSTWNGCSACHENIGAKLELATPHAPAAMGECYQCHSAHQSSRPGLLKDGVALLCQTCHEDMSAPVLEKTVSIHQPVLAGNCNVCHDAHGSAEKSLLIKPGEALCRDCHTDAKFTASHHLQAADLGCLDCHSPHASMQPALLRETPQATCVKCHDPRLSPTMVAHEPVKQGDCAICHDPHAGVGAKSLQQEPPMLCFNCHQNIARFVTAEHKHSVVEDCGTCHGAHEAPHKGLLLKPGSGVCADCHDVARDPAAKSVHKPFDQGDCGGCHNPHGSQFANLLGPRRQMLSTPVGQIFNYPKLDSTSVSLCRTCHADEIDLWQTKTVQHLPARNGECSACHSAHQSPNGNLLTKPTYELCQGCHDPAAIPAEPHRGINLASADCAQCHDPHASERKGLIKSNTHVPFGDGSCDACHTGPGSVTLTAAQPDLCLTCHEDLQTQLDMTVAHALAAGGECTACHSAHSSNEPHLLTGKLSSVCGSCHDATPGKIRHRPYAEGDCRRCHEPHGSAQPGLLVKNANGLCLDCHTTLAERMQNETRHGAIAEGCLACHAGHASDNASLLQLPPSELCGKCHDTKTAAWRAVHVVPGVAATGGDCMSCHDPHTTAARGMAMLKRSQHPPFEARECGACHEAGATEVRGDRQLCGQCHDETIAAIDGMPVVHAAMADSAACMTCHSPHVGDTPALLRKTGFSVCTNCHETINLADSVVHNPAREDCAICHTPHGGSDARLLSETDIMALCMRCHEDAPKTHFHAMGEQTKNPDNRGKIVCTSCHSPHNSAQKALLLGDAMRGLCVRCHDPSASHSGG